MTEKIWLKSYPAGVPATIDPSRYASLSELAEQSFAKFADRNAYTQMGRELSFRQLDQASREFGAWLQNHAGVRKGDRVAIMLPNVLQYPIALFGALRAGGTVVNTNPLYTARELEHQLQDSGAEVIVILENFAHVLQEVIAKTPVKHVVVTSVGEMLGFPKGNIVDYVIRHRRKAVPAWHIPGAIRFREALAAGRSATLAPVPLGHEDIAFLQYTGGTTGVSKGAMLTHRNMVANVLQSHAWVEGTFGSTQPETTITALPLYHIFALTANCLLFVMLGWQNVLITNPRDLPALVAEMRKYPFMFFAGVNTLFNGLLNTPGFERIDFEPYRRMLSHQHRVFNAKDFGDQIKVSVSDVATGSTKIVNDGNTLDQWLNVYEYHRDNGKKRAEIDNLNVIAADPLRGLMLSMVFDKARSIMWLASMIRGLRDRSGVPRSFSAATGHRV